jgi:DNA-binding transcriptional MocR family regulator
MDEFTRARVAKLAADQARYVVIDETMVDLWLDTPPPRPLAGLDRAGKVITLGSMGKSFWGGMRIGWIRAQPEMIAALAASRAANDMGSPILEQLAAAALLNYPEEGLAERREAVRRRRDHLLNLVQERLPEWRFDVPPGGLSVWAELPKPVSTALAAAAHALGVRAAPGGRFGVAGAFDRFMRLPYTLPEPQLTEVVDRLALAWEQVSASGGRSRTMAPAGLTTAI